MLKINRLRILFQKYKKIYVEDDNMDEVINYIEKNNSKDFKKEIENLETFRFDIDFRGLSEKIEK